MHTLVRYLPEKGELVLMEGLHFYYIIESVPALQAGKEEQTQTDMLT